MGGAQGPAITRDFAAQEAMGGWPMRTFRLVLANTLVQSIVNLAAWFVLIFRALLETRSVFVTGVIGGGGSARCSASALRSGSAALSTTTASTG